MTLRIHNQNATQQSNELVTGQQPVFTGADESAEVKAPESRAKLHEATWQAAQLKFTLVAANPQTGTRGTLTEISQASKEIDFDGAFVGAGRLAYTDDSDFNSVPAMMPRGKGPVSKQKIIHINGINNDQSYQGFTMRQIADTTRSPIIGIHNSTEGMQADLDQCLNDKNDIGKNPAVDTLTKTVLNELKHNRTVHIMGHSQGGLIAARALFRVETQLYKAARAEGLSREDAQIRTTRQMSKINVETFGAASTGYPDGPRYVHYINDCDNVPLQLGLGEKNPNIAPGKGAVIRHFKVEYLSMDTYLTPQKAGTQLSDKFVAPHSMEDVYLKFRLPFDQARREGGNRFMSAPVNGIVSRPGFIVHQKP